jgi:hypothetical protein
LSAQQDTDVGGIGFFGAESQDEEAISGGLLSVPDLMEAQGLQTEGRSDLEAWWTSWSLPSQQGARVREGVYPSVSGKLFPLLTRRGVEELLEVNEERLRGAEEVGEVLGNPKVEHALERAMGFHSQARSALQGGEGELALTLALRSADALWAVSPGRVASTLLTRAQGALRRNGGSAAYTQEEVRRIRRLTSGAEEALEDGDYPRAIRRAYYACQLLGVGTDTD